MIKVAFVGGGVMANAIISSSGCQKLWQPNEIAVAEPFEETRKNLAKLGLQTFASARELPKAQCYFLCVKPQNMTEALADLNQSNDFNKLAVISIAAGITLSTISKQLPGAQVVRAMPNTPLLVGQGCTFAYTDQNKDANCTKIASDIFATTGKFYWLDKESLMDAATAFTGSGPAYIYLVIETMAQQAQQMGIDEKVALEATVAVLEGACAMVTQTKEVPEELRRKVTSKAGTTFAALEVLEQRGFADALASAIEKARLRSEELSQ